jgi:hypothetical protein
VPPGWERFLPENNEAFRARLHEYRGNDDTSISFGGGEGKVFWREGAPTALKRWFRSQIGRMGRSVQRLIDVKAGVEAEPTLASDIDVVEVHETGPDWIYRDFDINTRPLSESGPAAEAARLRAIQKLEALRGQRRLTQPLKLLLDRLRSNSDNLHWSPAKNKIFVIDME